MVILHAEDQNYYGESFEMEFSTGAYTVDKINIFTLKNIFKYNQLSFTLDYSKHPLESTENLDTFDSSQKRTSVLFPLLMSIRLLGALKETISQIFKSIHLNYLKYPQHILYNMILNNEII